MQSIAACQFPDPLDWVEFRTVRRQVVQADLAVVLFPPGPVEFGMMIPCIVHDQDHRSIRFPLDSFQLLQELPKRPGVELVCFPPVHKLPIAQTHRAEIPHAPASREMGQHGIVDFRRHPHPAAGAVLLETHLIQRPQIHLAQSHTVLEFFFAWPGVADPTGP